jgi:hypothetical protein
VSVGVPRRQAAILKRKSLLKSVYVEANETSACLLFFDCRFKLGATMRGARRSPVKPG